MADKLFCLSFPLVFVNYRVKKTRINQNKISRIMQMLIWGMIYMYRSDVEKCGHFY